MNKYRIINGISFFVILIAILVVVGWFLDITLFKSILPNWVSMKLTTAICFFFSGSVLFFAAKLQQERKKWAQFVLPAASFIIFSFMIPSLAASFMDIETGIENIFLEEPLGTIATVKPGRSSVATIANFIVIATIALLYILKPKSFVIRTVILACIVVTVGAVAVLGYIFNAPLLYYFVENTSTAMALHTAILFCLLGIGFILLQKEKNEP